MAPTETSTCCRLPARYTSTSTRRNEHVALVGGGGATLLIQKRHAEENDAEDEEREDAIDGPHGCQVHEEHLEHGDAEERERSVSYGSARAQEAPAERRSRVDRPEHREPHLRRPPDSAFLVTRPVLAQHEEQDDGACARENASPKLRPRRGRGARQLAAGDRQRRARGHARDERPVQQRAGGMAGL